MSLSLGTKDLNGTGFGTPSKFIVGRVLSASAAGFGGHAAASSAPMR